LILVELTMNNELRTKFGLTLVEILIVVAVIALLAAMVIGISSRIDNQAKEKGMKNIFTVLDGALQEYYEYKGFFPEQTEEDFANADAHSEYLYDKLNSIPDSRKVLEQISNRLIQNSPDSPSAVPEIYDLWGTVLDYIYQSGENFPRLTSAGPDKEFGTPDDISNR